MDAVVDEKKLKKLASELAKQIKTEEDLGELSSQLVKMTVEAALGAEMEDHLGYEKHAPEGRNSGNSRNGTSSKKLKGKHGEVAIDTPRDRNGMVPTRTPIHQEPKIIRRSPRIGALNQSKSMKLPHFEAAGRVSGRREAFSPILAHDEAPGQAGRGFDECWLIRTAMQQSCDLSETCARTSARTP